MSEARKLQDHLPLLRRYARALCGNQRQGDALVLAALQNLVNSPPATDGNDVRVRLYQVLSRLWNGIAGEYLSQDRDADTAGSGALARLAHLTPHSRQAFLLTAMEGFSAGEAARILEVSQPTFDGLLAKARAEVSAQMETRVLIIEDEIFVAIQLEEIVKELGHTLIATERTCAAAVATAAAQKPGLILADIQLADGSSGLDAVNQILALHQVPAIFITAFPERLLTGQQPEPTYLIMKPFQDDHVRAVISQALFFADVPSPETA